MAGNYIGYSAEVKMHIVWQGSEIRICQLGPDFLLLEEAHEFEGWAQVVLSVDGKTHRRDVQLECVPTANQKTIAFIAA
jgi:hypothetical protein